MDVDRDSLIPRAQGCLVGLGVGDALGAPAENLTAAQIAERWGEVTDFLNDSTQGTDDTEYACLIGLLLVQTQGHPSTEQLIEHYRHHVLGREVLRGAGFSELGTVENLRRGWTPPDSGHHAHPWSDGLAMRAAVHGIVAAGDPRRARELAALDGSVCAATEGIWAGQFVAGVVARVLAGEPVPAAIEAEHGELPEASWTAAAVQRGRTLTDPHELLENLVSARFPWTDLAPEAVGIATWCCLRHPTSFAAAVTTAVSLGRDADTTAAIAGAIVGSATGIDGIRADWRSRLGLVTGRCLGEAVAGIDLADLAEQLATVGGR